MDVTEGPGSGVRVLNQSPLAPFKESVQCAEQNLYVRAKELVGDRDPRQREFSIQLRAFDSAKSGTAVGVGVHDLAAKITIHYYLDARDALLKALAI